MKNMNYIFVMLISFSACSNWKVKNENIKGRIASHHFKSENEAESFFYSRRLDYLRYYQLTSEPYFGTSEELDCKNNIDIKAEVKTHKKFKYYLIKIIEDKSENITDCLLNDQRRVLFLSSIICQNSVYILKDSKELVLNDLEVFCR